MMGDPGFCYTYKLKRLVLFREPFFFRSLRNKDMLGSQEIATLPQLGRSGRSKMRLERPSGPNLGSQIAPKISRGPPWGPPRALKS